MTVISNFERLRQMSNAQVTQIWDAIMSLDGFERAELGDEWQEDVYSELSARGIPAFPHLR
jgi:hypothetical protein